MKFGPVTWHYWVNTTTVALGSERLIRHTLMTQNAHILNGSM